MADRDWERITKNFDQANEIFYSLVEKLTTLSTGALALSIALRENFIPKNPKEIWLLVVSWCSFVVTILLGVAIVWGRHEVYKAQAMNLFHNPEKALHVERPSFFSRFAANGIFVAFLVAIVALMVFAVINVTNA